MARYEDFVRVLRRPRLLVRPAAAAAIALAALIVGDALQLDPREVFAPLGIAAVLCFSVSRDPARFAFGVALLMAVGGFHTAREWGHVLKADRTFFGIYRVSEDQQRGLVTLFHGTTVHGRQALGPIAPEPLTYYHRQSPIGRVFSTQGERLPLSVGVVGSVSVPWRHMPPPAINGCFMRSTPLSSESHANANTSGSSSSAVARAASPLVTLDCRSSVRRRRTTSSSSTRSVPTPFLCTS